MTLHLEGKTISGDTILIRKKQATVLGPGLLLTRCHIRLETDTRALTLAGVRFSDCVIEAKKELKNFRWCSAFLEKSRFLGTFVGCDFGGWPEHYGSDGGIEECDFSESILDGCRFFGGSVDSVKLPPWPCFAIESPKAAAERMKALEWPERLQFWAEGLDWAPEEAKILVEFAPKLIERFGGTEALLRKSLREVGHGCP